MIIDQKSIIVLNQLEGVIWAKYSTMEQTPQNYDFVLKGEEFLKKRADKTEKSNKCSQCDFASSWAASLRTHLKAHSGQNMNDY